MDENGVMFIDGVELVNVISIKARVDGTEEESRRKRLRERADSDLGTGTEQDVGKIEVMPPVPVPVLVAAPGHGQVHRSGEKVYFGLTALPEMGVGY